MSEGSAVDDIMTPHVGCLVTFKEGNGGPGGQVLALMGDKARVYWGHQDRRRIEKWEPLGTLRVSMTAKQVKAMEERQKGMTYG